MAAYTNTYIFPISGFSSPHSFMFVSKKVFQAQPYELDCFMMIVWEGHSFRLSIALVVNHLLVWRHWVNDMMTNLSQKHWNLNLISITFWRRWNSAREAWAAGAAYRVKSWRGRRIAMLPQTLILTEMATGVFFWMIALPWFLRSSWTREDVNSPKSIGW